MLFVDLVLSTSQQSLSLSPFQFLSPIFDVFYGKYLSYRLGFPTLLLMSLRFGKCSGHHLLCKGNTDWHGGVINSSIMVSHSPTRLYLGDMVQDLVFQNFTGWSFVRSLSFFSNGLLCSKYLLVPIDAEGQLDDPFPKDSLCLEDEGFQRSSRSCSS